jgi:hypothetical protein
MNPQRMSFVNVAPASMVVLLISRAGGGIARAWRGPLNVTIARLLCAAQCLIASLVASGAPAPAEINLPDQLTYDAYGDSLTQGLICGTYLTQLGALNPGWQINNNGIGGAFTADYAPLILGRDIGATNVSSLLIGTGDSAWMNGPDY